MRKHGCAAGLAVLLLVVGMAEAEAQSISEFPCQIDLGKTDDEGAFEIDPTGAIVPEDLRLSYGSFRQLKVCQGQARNVRVNCSALVVDWPFNERLVTSEFTCLINAAECGIEVEDTVDGLAVAERASLQIASTQSSRCGQGAQARSCGLATIECRLR